MEFKKLDKIERKLFSGTIKYLISESKRSYDTKQERINIMNKIGGICTTLLFLGYEKDKKELEKIDDCLWNNKEEEALILIESWEEKGV